MLLFGIDKFLNRSKGCILVSLSLLVLLVPSKERSLPSEADSGLELPGADGSFLLEREDVS